jgi:hypothetical protein
MTKSVRLVREGKFAAEVSIELIEESGGWSPYISAADAGKLDAVRKSLRNGDLKDAARYGRVFELTPIAV